MSSVVIEQTLAQVVVDDTDASTLILISEGPQGPQGPPGVTNPIRFDVPTPAGTWIIPHGFGRVPTVQLFDLSGNSILSDLNVDATHITVVFGSPQAGFALAM